MLSEIQTTQNKLSRTLDSSLNNAAAIITKSYLDRLETYDIMRPSEEDIDVDIVMCGKFYKLTRLVLNKEENFLNKLTTIVNVASSIGCSITTIIRSDGYRIDYYLGILSKNARNQNEISRNRRIANAEAFKGALSGNLIGSELEEISDDKVELFQKEDFKEKGKLLFCGIGDRGTS